MGKLDGAFAVAGGRTVVTTALVGPLPLRPRIADNGSVAPGANRGPEGRVRIEEAG